MRIKAEADRLLAMIREGRTMSAGQKVRLAVMLSVPAVVAQLSSIVMQYIDASMVGSLGAEASAAIGLVSTTTWLFGGLLSAAASGFSVQVAHRIGAGDWEGAQRVLRQSVVAVLAFSLLLASIGAGISSSLPVTSRCVDLFPDNILVSSSASDAVSCWRHAAVQRQYARAEHGGSGYVRP